MRHRFAKKPPYMPLFVADYIKDTLELSTEEHGAYLLLLMHAWTQPDCGLTTDNRKLARIIGISSQKWARMKGDILGLWTLDGDRWYQERLYQERVRAEERSEMASKAASERWKNHRPNQENDSRGGVSVAESEEDSDAGNSAQDIENIECEVCDGICECNATQPQPQFLEEEDDDEGETFILVAEDGKPPPDIIDQVVAAWNEAATRCKPMARCVVVNEDRAKGIRKLVSEYGLETVLEQFRKLPEQGFIAAGGTHGDFKPGIDFFFRKGKFTRLMENGYSKRPGKKSGWN